MYLGFFDIDKKQIFFIDNVEIPVVGVPLRNEKFSFLPKTYLIEYVETILFKEMDLQDEFEDIAEKAFVALFFRKVGTAEIEDFEEVKFNEFLWEMMYEDVAEVMDRMEEENEDY